MRFFPEFEVDLTVTVNSVTGFTKGIYNTVAQAPIQLRAVVQPMQPEDLNQLPDGARLESSLKFFSKTELPIDDYSTTDTKVVVENFQGKDYRVVSRKKWRNSDHIKYIAVELRYDT